MSSASKKLPKRAGKSKAVNSAAYARGLKRRVAHAKKTNGPKAAKMLAGYQSSRLGGGPQQQINFPKEQE